MEMVEEPGWKTEQLLFAVDIRIHTNWWDTRVWFTVRHVNVAFIHVIVIGGVHLVDSKLS
jgi:hypothetical protein